MVIKKQNFEIKFKLDSDITKRVDIISNCLPNNVVMDVAVSDYDMKTKTFQSNQYFIQNESKILVQFGGRNRSIKRLFAIFIP